eukprot:10143202-Alexandrium_andersonii.AAC.1
MNSGNTGGLLRVPNTLGVHEAQERSAASSGDGGGVLRARSPSEAHEPNSTYCLLYTSPSPRD